MMSPVFEAFMEDVVLFPEIEHLAANACKVKLLVFRIIVLHPAEHILKKAAKVVIFMGINKAEGSSYVHSEALFGKKPALITILCKYSRNL